MRSYLRRHRFGLSSSISTCVLVAAHETSYIPEEVKDFGENICWRILPEVVAVADPRNT